MYEDPVTNHHVALVNGNSTDYHLELAALVLSSASHHIFGVLVPLQAIRRSNSVEQVGPSINMPLLLFEI